MSDISESRRWLNVAERAELEQAWIPALLGIGHALLAIAEHEEAKSSRMVPAAESRVVWR